MTFVNLHCHYEYSILDGAAKVGAAVNEAARLGQPALSMTDHGTLGGVYEFWKRCTATGGAVNPIIGLEAYVAPASRTLKEPVFWGTPDQRRDDVSGGGKYLHLTLLAQNVEGLRNLYRLQHSGYAEGFYGKPRLDFESLGSHSEGLVCLTGCPGGHLQTAIRLGLLAEAHTYLGILYDIFKNRLYVELMDHGLDIEKKVRKELLECAKKFGLPLVATADSHYVLEGDSDIHDTLLCIQTKKPKSASDRFRFDGSGYHLGTHREMDGLFGEIPGAIDNSLAIAQSVEGYGEFFSRQLHLPRYSDDEPGDLRRLAYVGLGINVWESEYVDRLDYELEVINSQGYAGYFLTLKELLDEGRKSGIRFGPGRGSAGGSLVGYTLGLTELDPILHGLLFERFLNPERISFPDIDVDIDDVKRDRFIEGVRAKFGETHVAQAGTYGTIGARGALRDAARVLGHPYEVGTKLVSLLPRPKAGRQPTLSELPSSAGPQEVVDAAKGVEGIIRSASVHASAVVISSDNLVDLIPLRYPGGKGKSPLTTEFTGTELDELGYLKYDFLGLSNLGVIDECLTLLQSGGLLVQPPTTFDDSELQLLQSSQSVCPSLPTTFNDSKTFALLSEGRTAGVFQLDGDGMRSLLRKLRPSSIDDIAAVLALYRPGPMGANSHQAYADRKNGRANVEFPHSEYETVLADILSPTYGLIVFQEQVLRVLSAVGGYTYGTAGLIFDAMRKKDEAKMEAARPEFLERLRQRGYSEPAIEALWNTLVPFSDYSFGKAHSMGYAYISYWTAFLKANYPREFWCSLLTRTKSKKKDEEQTTLRALIRSAISDGVPILPPDINDSEYGWTITDEGIRFGLGAVRGISRVTYDHIAQGRPYLSMEEWWKRAHPKVLNLSVTSAAIRCGAFDKLEPNREGLAKNAEAIAARAIDDRKLATQGQRRLWQTYSVVPGGLERHMGLRQTWEEELLGIPLTTRAIKVRLRRPLQEVEWMYLRKTMEAHYGNQPVDVEIGPLTTLRGVSMMSLTKDAVRSLEALGGVEVEQEQ